MDEPCRLSLVPFEPAEQFTCSVAVKRESGLLQLEYCIAGPLARLSIPREAPRPGFVPGLWRHTCCECFLRQDNAAGYTEWNFALDCNWWTSRFTGYRKPASEQPASAEPADFQIHLRQNMITLLAAIACPEAAVLQVGPAVVLEHSAQSRSYWALEHPGDRPDFHQPHACIPLR